jgi:DNA-binding winged helix-turn-helix (wHTH) protein/Tol biopolymer transport system component
MEKLAQRLYEFGSFRLDPANRRLLHRGEPVALTPKLFDTLVLLVENCGRLIKKDEFMERLWPGTFVGEDTLAQNVSLLRKALNGIGDGQEYVATVPKRGYRFVLRVTEVTDESTGQLGGAPVEGSRDVSGLQLLAAKEDVSKRLLGRPRRVGFLAAVITFSLTAFVSFWWFSPSPVPRVIRSIELTHSGRVESWGRIVMDGGRLLFLEREGPRWNLVQMSVGGGEPQAVPAPFQNTRIMDISPDQTEFLVASFIVHEKEMPLWIMPAAGGSPRRVGEITAGDAIWYPDGQRILYAKGSDLYLVGRDGAEPRRLVSTGGVPEWPVWSPDKRRLRFTLWNPASESGSLWEVAADGTGLHPLLPGWSNPPVECCGRWTRDGRYFLFSSGHEGASNVWAIRETARLFRLRRPQPVQLTTGPTEFWGGLPSADGKRLLIFGKQPQVEMVRYDAKSQQFLPYLAGTRAAFASFSSDGDLVAYVTSSEDALWRSRADGASRLQLTFPPERVHDPRWSPDGKQIAFWTSLSGKSPKTYVISSEGGPPREVAPEWNSRARPDWSPDGKSLVFEAFGEPSRTDALYRIDLETNEVIKLAGSEGFIAARWSPNGRYIAAITNKQDKLMLFDFRARQWAQEAQGTFLTSLNWSRDGKDLYFQDILGAQQPVYRLRVSSLRQKRVPACEMLPTTGVLRCGFVGLAPGDTPVLQLFRHYADIYALDLDLP